MKISNEILYIKIGFIREIGAKRFFTESIYKGKLQYFFSNNNKMKE
jgi:hypothetical protein